MQSSPDEIPVDFAVFVDRHRRTIVKPLSQRAVEWMIAQTEASEDVTSAWHEVQVSPADFTANMPDDYVFALPTLEELFGIGRGLH